MKLEVLESFITTGKFRISFCVNVIMDSAEMHLYAYQQFIKFDVCNPFYIISKSMRALWLVKSAMVYCASKLMEKLRIF